MVEVRHLQVRHVETVDDPNRIVRKVGNRFKKSNHLLVTFFGISGRRGMWLVRGAAKLCCSVNVTAAAALSTSCGSSSRAAASAAFLREAAA